MPFKKLAEVWRGSIVESVHFGVAAVANAEGEVLHGWGDPDYVTFPRSALKPIQAIPFVESGAHKAFNLDARHLALACASHRGEPIHTEMATQWLERLGLSEDDLACGPAYPRDADAVEDLIRAGHAKSRIIHNCSGKHCGFLTVARHLGWQVEGYNRRDHPSQQLYLDALSDLLGHDPQSSDFATDGCTLPAVALSLGDMAKAMARFAAAKVSSAGRKSAILQIHAAARGFPEYMSGVNRPTEQLVRATEGRVIMKNGAEGFITAFVPESGLGIALKIADGSSRARIAVLMSLLNELKLLDDAAEKALRPLFEVPVTNSVGDAVGRIRPYGFQETVRRLPSRRSNG